MAGTDVEIRIGLKGIEAVRGQLRTLGADLTAFGRDMTTRLTAPIAAAGAGIVLSFDNIKKAMDSVQIATGATGEQLKELQDIARDVAASVPQGFQQTADVVSTLNTITGATGEQLRGLARDVLDLSRVLGEDATANAAAFGQALQQFEVPLADSQRELALMFRVSQETGISFSGLTRRITEYGSVLKNAGFTMSESAVLFGELFKAGISVSRVMPGLNMAMRRWAQENRDVQAELAASVDRIRTAKDATEALAIATEVFGAEGAQRLVTAIRSGAFELDNLAERANAAVPSIQQATEGTKTFGERMAELSAQVALALEPLGGALVEAFDGLRPVIEGAIAGLADAVRAFAEMDPWVQKLIIGVTGFAAAVGPVTLAIGGLVAGLGAVLSPAGLVVTALGALVAAGVALAENWDKVTAMAEIAWNKVKLVVLTAVDGILGAFEAMTGFIPVISEKFGAMRASIQADVAIAKDEIDRLRDSMREAGRQAEQTAQSTDIMTGAVSSLAGTVAATARSDLELFNEQMFQLNDLFNRGIITAEQYQRGIENLREVFGSFGNEVASAAQETEKLNRSMERTINTARELRSAVAEAGGGGVSRVAPGGRRIGAVGGGVFRLVEPSQIAEARQRLLDTGLVDEARFQRIIEPRFGEDFSTYFSRLARQIETIESQNRDLIRDAQRRQQRERFARTFGEDAAARRFGGSFGTGGTAVFDKPTFIQVGEQGPEMVDVRPLGRSAGRRPPPVTVIFQGPNIVDEISRRNFVREIVQQMRAEGLRYGGA